MKLTKNGKKKLLTSAHKVYLAYTALDFFKTKTFSTPDGQKSLSELCTKAINDNKIDQTVVINGIHYRLDLTQENNNYKIKFTRAVGARANSVVKKISDYTDQEVLNLLANQEFSIQAPVVDEKPVVSNRISDDYVIGGAGKVDLYRTHLVTLHNIIEKIESEEDISNLLVALATGSGKTFVQALWMMVLSLSDNNGVFAIPDKLVNQFTKDLKRLLPDELVNKMVILRDKEENLEAEETLRGMAQVTDKGILLIGSSECLLDRHYQDLMNTNSQNTFFSFDEQHLLMKAERRRIRLIELSKNKLSMFLTATPNQETYALSGYKPVAIMSSGQKQEAGQGQFPQLYSHQARNVSDRNQLKDYRFWTADFWQNMFNGILLRVTNSIQEEQSSAAVSLVDDLPFYYHMKKGETTARWGMQVPAARKMLCIVDDNETLVNFCHALDQSSSDRRDVYRNGNLINRGDVARFFGIPDAEVELIRSDIENKRAEYRANMNGDKASIAVGEKTLAQQLKDNIFHSMIEYVLTDLTGYDEIEHNRLRKNNLNYFNELVKSRFQLKTADYYQQKLAKDIDAEGAQAIGELLADLSKVMQTMIAGNFVPDGEQNKKDLMTFIDNWSLHDELMDKIKLKDHAFTRKFEHYAQSHVMLAVMSGMHQAETPIAESRPFAGLDQQTYQLYDNNGLLVERAKKRKHTSLEILSDTSNETSFTPDYLDFSEEIADNYFRLGFVGAYVSNKKTEGFSDRNLHTVINIAEERLSLSNSPDTQIQGIGRNRGLDETVEPVYIHSLGRGQRSIFDLANLQSDDYYPELFTAQGQYNEEYIKVLGTQVSKKTIAWVYENMDKDETLNGDRLKRQVLKFITQALRDLNNKNGHQIKLSRAQLTDVVNYAMSSLDEEIEHLNKPYRVSTFVTILGIVLNFVSQCYYSVIRLPAALSMYYHSWFGQRTSAPSEATEKHADDVYIKILSGTSFKKIISNMSPALELRNWLTRKAEGVQAHISKNVSSYIRHDIIEGFNIHQKQFLEPLIVKLVIDSKKEQVANALANFPQLINLFNASENNLGNLLNGDSDQFEVTVLRLLKQIPGLENLVVTDVVNYPENMKVIQELLNGNPAQLLLNKDMQSDLTYPLTKYLQGDFIKYLSAFITYPQVKRVEQILAKKNNAQQFVQHCLAQIFNGDLELDPEHIFTELKNYFNIKELSLINEEMDELQVGISALEKEIKDNLIQSLDEEHIQQLMSILREQLLPVLVNVFPLQHRSELLNTASKSSKLKRLIQVHGKEILALMEHKKEELPVFIFSKLSRNSLPDLIDIPQHAKDAELLFKDKFAEILQAGLIGLSLRKLTAFSSWNLNPKYMHDAAIANFLQSDECLDAISLMLPHNQWLQLKADVSQNYSGLITIARILIDKAAAGDSLELKPAQILELLNQHLETEYTSPEQTLVQASEALREITKEATANPMAMLNTEIQDKFAQLATAHLLPLLACFIKDNDKKMQFLNLKRDNERVYQFIVANSEVLSTFNGQSEESMRLLGFNLVNQLMPDDSKLVLDDMIHPQSNATNLAPIIKKEVQKITLITFFNSKTFKDLMKDYLNPQDFTLLMNYLSVPDQQSVLADKMISRGVESLDREAILSLVKSTDPTLASISPMDEGFNSIKDYLVEMSSEMTEAFDTYKISQLMSSSIIPVLFHEQFIKIIDEVLGFLNEQDLTVLFEAMDNPHPAEEAKQLLEFIHLIRVQDQEALTQKFISLPEGVNGLSLDVLPAKKMLDNIKDLIEEVLDCHCHYHQQDRKGLQYGNVSPKLISKVSPELKDIRIASDYSFFSGFSRKIFYIQGINEGVEAAGQISADSNKHVVAILQRVKSHILRPLWWSTNVSNFSHGFVKHSRDVVDGIISGYYGALNGVKSALNWICGRNVFTVSAKNSESEDFNNTAFDFALEINELEAMTPAQVEKTDCRMDVVKNLEEFIAQRPSRAGFFPASTDADLSTLSEERNAGYGL